MNWRGLNSQEEQEINVARALAYRNHGPVTLAPLSEMEYINSSEDGGDEKALLQSHKISRMILTRCSIDSASKPVIR